MIRPPRRRGDLSGLRPFRGMMGRSYPTTGGRHLGVEWLEDRSVPSGFTEYLVPTLLSNPQAITTGPDGALWFTENSANKIGRVTTSGVFTEYTVPTSNAYPTGITTGPDNALWFVEQNANKIGRVTTSGVFTEYTIPSSNSAPSKIAASPDGTLWFSESNDNKIGRITVGGSITEYPISGGGNTRYIAVGADGAIWYTNPNNNKIGRITSPGTYTEFSIQDGGADPRDIVVASDGSAWFTQAKSSHSAIVHINTDGSQTAFQLANSGATPIGITEGADGAFWFTEYGLLANRIGRIDSAGVITEYAIPTLLSLPVQITLGPDNALWFTESGTNQIGRFSASPTIILTTQTIATTEGTTYAGTLGSFTSSDLASTPTDYTTMVDWGDGTTGPVTITAGAAGTFTLNGTHTYTSSGRYAVSIQVTDAFGTTTTDQATATVADAPLTASPTLSNPTEGTAFSGVVASFTDANAAATAADFTATIDWGDGQSTSSSVSYNSGAGQFKVTGTHTYAHSGTYQQIVTINDVGGATATTTATITVIDAALSASSSAIATTEGTPLSQVVATFTDANPLATTADFTATIDWGDGATTSGAVAFDTTTQQFTISGSHAFVQAGVYTMIVTIHDIGGSSASTVSGISVADAALTAGSTTLTTMEGAAPILVVATFHDANPLAVSSQFTAAINWGDGTTTSGNIAYNASTGRFEVNGSHAYTQAGIYSRVVTITDFGGSTATTTGNVIVDDAALSSTAANRTVNEGESTNQIVASVTDANPLAVAGQFSATINWGDGSSSLGLVAFNPGTGKFDVSGTHAYVLAGNYVCSVNISDSGGSTTTVAATVTVLDVAITATAQDVTVDTGTSTRIVAASFTDLNPYAVAADYTAVIDWGDGTTSPGVVAYNTNTSQFDVTATHVYTLAGQYTRVVSILDSGGSTAMVAANVTSVYVPITALGQDQSVIEGHPLSGVIATFLDASPTLTVADFTTAIDWGDGTTSPGVVTLNNVAGTYEVSGSHTYLRFGTYPISVTIEDSNGTQTVASATSNVSDAPLNGNPIPITSTDSLAFSGAVARFRDANPFALAGDYTAVIDWGDGTNSAGTITIDPQTGDFLVEGSHAFSATGHLSLAVSIRDDGGSSLNIDTTAHITALPIQAQPIALSGVERTLIGTTVATFTHGSPFAQASDFSALINWGDGRTTQATIVDDPLHHTFQVQAPIIYSTIGVYSATITISGRGSTSTVVSTFVITETPIIATGTSWTESAGIPFNRVVASFRGEANDTLDDTYSATIHWGDGHSSIGRIQFNTITGQYDVSGSHEYSIEGNYSIGVTIQIDGATAARVVTIATILEAPLQVRIQPIQAKAGTPFSGVIGTFRDLRSPGSLSNYTATITWGDGQTSQGTISYDAASAEFAVRGEALYAMEGIYPVTLVITDRGGAEGTTSSTAIVADAPLSAIGQTLTLIRGQTFHGVVALFSDASSRGQASDFTTQIHWGDGTTSPGLVSMDRNGRFVITGRHAYGQPGDHAITVQIIDRGGAKVTAQSIAAVSLEPTTLLSSIVATVVPQSSPIPVTNSVLTPTLPLPPIFQPLVGMTTALPSVLGAAQLNVPADTRATNQAMAAPSLPGHSTSSSSAPTTNSHHGNQASAAAGGNEASEDSTGLRIAIEGAAQVASQLYTAAITGLSRLIQVEPVSQPKLITELSNFTRRSMRALEIAPNSYLWQELETVSRQIDSGDTPKRVATVFGTGAIAYVGYVLLHTRGGYALLSLLTARPLWTQFDPLNVILDFEDDRKHGRTREEDEETLQSLVGDSTPSAQDDVRTDHVATQPRTHKHFHKSFIRLTRARSAARPRLRKNPGAKKSL